MRLIALMPCRNEDWVVGLSARVALMWCDAVVLYVHASTDRSWEIACGLVEEYRGRVCAIRDDEPIWDEMQHRQRMLCAARQAGATHIGIVDADEVLTGSFGSDHRLSTIYAREFVARSNESCILQLPGYNLRGGLHRYHATGIWGSRWFSVAFADDPCLGWQGDRFHHREPMGRTLAPYRPVAQGAGGILHLWGASERRLRAKHAAYKVQERLRWPDRDVRKIDQMYSLWLGIADGSQIPWIYADVPAEWWAPYAHLMQHLHVDAEPWQERYVREMVAKHGAETFRGMDLFGVDRG